MIFDMFTGKPTVPHYNIDFRADEVAEETGPNQLELPL